MTTACTVRLNGTEREVATGATLRDLVTDLTGHPLHDDGSRVDGGRLGVAAALGGVVVPRSRWATRTVAEGDEIEIVTAAQGG